MRFNEDQAVAMSDLETANTAGNGPHVVGRYHTTGPTLEWIEHHHPVSKPRAESLDNSARSSSSIGAGSDSVRIWLGAAGPG